MNRLHGEKNDIFKKIKKSSMLPFSKIKGTRASGEAQLIKHIPILAEMFPNHYSLMSESKYYREVAKLSRTSGM